MPRVYRAIASRNRHAVARAPAAARSRSGSLGARARTESACRTGASGIGGARKATPRSEVASTPLGVTVVAVRARQAPAARPNPMSTAVALPRHAGEVLPPANGGLHTLTRSWFTPTISAFERPGTV